MRQRLAYLDNLRVFLTMLVVVFHTSIAYGASGSWILVDVEETSLLLTIFTGVCQSFFIGLFFMISAYFIPGAYDRKGAVLFLRDRLVRLGIPLLVYYFVIGPMTVWAAHYRGEKTLTQFYNEQVWSFRSTFFGPAWFLEASIYFALLYVLFRLVVKDRLTPRQPVPFPGGKALFTVAIILGLTAFLTRLVYPTGEGPLELQLGYFPSYILLFLTGIMAYRHEWLAQARDIQHRYWKWLAVPATLTGIVLVLVMDGGSSFSGGVNLQAFLYAMWEPFICFAIILSLLVRFQHQFNTVTPISKWLSANAYAVYLIHPAVIVGWTMAFQGVGWPPVLKWIIVSALSVAVCFGAASLIRKLPFAKRVL
jgi:glucans biosynthesis protein C